MIQFNIQAILKPSSASQLDLLQTISFRFAVTPGVYLNHRQAEVQVLKRTLSHDSYLNCR